ncbi:GntR family transcriptional regulator [Aestuariimicrobium sp. p3-SID1156]|uniref:GntR family transcriptional regulator n=1 Tax=Aestuariimicrobium sp. p3-SID1156 TaxID=2916038 RepID=UPI00223C15F6|nr:GntR family transcriptional regulator [Aestuariimicrobium sp. p3-SID1156]MCT1459769.1 GntR family transcriptional regulator [Aestuariimicrobium sp. p3-SID1156]
MPRELAGEANAPLYRRVQRSLLDEVRVRQMQPGARLWSENEICEEFGVARSVARQALAGLEAQGIVERVRGSGTFLASATPRDGLLSSVRGLHADAAVRGQEVTSRVLSHAAVPAPEWVAHQLELDRGTPCVRLRRIRLIDGAPWTYVESWVPAPLVPGILRHDLSRGSLYALLADEYGLMVTSASRSVEADRADAELARHLEVTVGDPLLVLRSVGRDPSARPVDVFTAWHRADRSRFVVEIKHPHSGGHVEPV